MRSQVCIGAAFLAGLLACERGGPMRDAVSKASRDGGPAVAADLGADAGQGRTVLAPPLPPNAESPVRQRIGPLVRFQLVPVGASAVEPARAALPGLRQRYQGYGFDLGATLAALPSSAVDCTAFLNTLVGARGTLFVLGTPLRCASPFGALDRRLAAAVVPLPPLGKTGSPEASRRLAALLAADVGEILGLSYPCTAGKTCCPLRSAPDLRLFDVRASVSDCPQHAEELGRIRTDAGLQ